MRRLQRVAAQDLPAERGRRVVDVEEVAVDAGDRVVAGHGRAERPRRGDLARRGVVQAQPGRREVRGQRVDTDPAPHVVPVEPGVLEARSHRAGPLVEVEVGAAAQVGGLASGEHRFGRVGAVRGVGRGDRDRARARGLRGGCLGRGDGQGDRYGEGADERGQDERGAAVEHAARLSLYFPLYSGIDDSTYFRGSFAQCPVADGRP